MQVCVGGVRDSNTFRTKREADAWAAARETEMRANAKKMPGERHTLADALNRYAEEVSDTKRGARWEKIRINRFMGDVGMPLDVLMADLLPTDFSRWRDERLKTIKPNSLIREVAILSACMEHARIEWRWIDKNPIADLKKPSPSRHREVVISPQQVRLMIEAMGYTPNAPIREYRQAIAVCFLVALRTGMRAGELCGLTWDRVKADYCILPITKTTPRNVSLSDKALRLIDKMRGFDERLVFGIPSSTLDAMFRKYRSRAGLTGFTFHDSRHTAATMLARSLDVLDLCKMFGWSNPKQAMIYYNPTASDIAARLNAKRPSAKPRRSHLSE